VHLGEIELAALDHLWDVEEAGVIELHAAIGAPRKITANTVGSALKRLHRKGLVEREKVSHAYRYRAAQPKDVFTVGRILDSVSPMDASMDVLFRAMVNILGVDLATLDRLQTLIAQKRRNHASQ
jgi:predicted transcriptional regulator